MKKFKITVAALAGIGIFLLLLAFGIHSLKKSQILPRANSDCLTEERVFDYADVLTDEEEDNLRRLISETEPEIGCDIVLMTINDTSLTSDNAMMNFADDFYDNNQFGWNEPWGDGAIYVDNWGRDEYGYAYTWFSTSGKVEDRYSMDMIDDLIGDVCDNVNDDPYGAYVKYVKTLRRDMTNSISIPWGIAPFFGLIAAIIFIFVNLPNKEGKVTTTKQTYVKKEDVKMLSKEDTFLSKNITHVRVSSSGSGSGSGGGGGHHMSSGGHSHGGGGGRH